MNGTIAGIVCARCSHGYGPDRVQVRHESIEAVKNCRGPVSPAPENMPDNRIATVVTKAAAPVLPGPDVWAKVRQLQNRMPDERRVHFAIEVLDFEVGPDPVTKFYLMEKPQDGKWAGRTFLSVQAGETHWPLKRPESIANVLEAYLHDPEAALARYGREFKRCGICNRGLTVKASRDRGIGPDCAAKLGL